MIYADTFSQMESSFSNPYNSRPRDDPLDVYLLIIIIMIITLCQLCDNVTVPILFTF